MVVNRVGMVVRRKRDNARGVVVSQETSVPSVAHPGVYGKTIVSIRLDDPELRQSAGGDMTGDLSWLKSNFAKGA